MDAAEQKWVDISGLLEAACQEMSPDELIHGEHFSLYEAMSAIEIGCIKMDAGATKTATVDELIEQGKAPTDISAAQLLAVLDKLLALEANWQSGDSMAQTIYSCLYMLTPERQVQQRQHHHRPLHIPCPPTLRHVLTGLWTTCRCPRSARRFGQPA
jgi:N-alpha-acetyltransferase 35, NatC auxiliary subunit